MAWGQRKKNTDDIIEVSVEPDPPRYGYLAIVTLIKTRLDAATSFDVMRAAGLDDQRAVRYLDLALIVAARELLSEMGDAVVLPIEYDPTFEIPGLSNQFADCLLCAELVEVYRAEPIAATLLGPLAPDFIAVNQELKKAPGATLGLPAPTVGDGKQVGFARTAFGHDGVEKLAASWPDLA